MNINTRSFIHYIDYAFSAEVTTDDYIGKTVDEAIIDIQAQLRAKNIEEAHFFPDDDNRDTMYIIKKNTATLIVEYQPPMPFDGSN